MSGAAEVSLPTPGRTLWISETLWMGSMAGSGEQSSFFHDRFSFMMRFNTQGPHVAGRRDSVPREVWRMAAG